MISIVNKGDHDCEDYRLYKKKQDYIPVFWFQHFFNETNTRQNTFVVRDSLTKKYKKRINTLDLFILVL